MKRLQLVRVSFFLAQYATTAATTTSTWQCHKSSGTFGTETASTITTTPTTTSTSTQQLCLKRGWMNMAAPGAETEAQEATRAGQGSSQCKAP